MRWIALVVFILGFDVTAIACLYRRGLLVEEGRLPAAEYDVASQRESRCA